MTNTQLAVQSSECKFWGCIPGPGSDSKLPAEAQTGLLAARLVVRQAGLRSCLRSCAMGSVRSKEISGEVLYTQWEIHLISVPKKQSVYSSKPCVMHETFEILLLI